MRPLEFYFDYESPRHAPPILLDCFDADKNWLGGDKKPTFMGRAIIHLETYDSQNKRNHETDAAVNYCGDDKVIPEPKFHNFYYDTYSS